MSVQRRERKLKSGKVVVYWVVRWRDASGKQHSQNFDSQRAAKKFNTDVEKEKSKGAYGVDYDHKITLEEYSKDWLSRPIRQGTIRGYKQAFTQASMAGLSSIPMVQVTQTQVQKFYNDLIAGRPWMDGTSLAVSTADRHLLSLRALFSQACSEGVIPRDPTKGIRKVRSGSHRAVDKSEIPSIAEVKLVESTIRNGGAVYLKDGAKETIMAEHPVIADMILFGALTGCRISEVLGLKGKDIDTENKMVYVRGQKSQIGTEIAPVKFHDSEREIPYPDDIHEMLCQRVENAGDDGFIFSSSSGSYNSSYVAAVLRRVQEHLEVENPFVFHSLRHLYASMMIASGCPIPVISKLLGHSTPSVTLGIYVHVMEDYEKTSRGFIGSVSSSFFEEK